MKSNIKIDTIQNGEKLQTLEIAGDYTEIDKEHIISYLELEYVNTIIIEKQTNIVIVEKRGTGSNQYYSKLIFEFQKKHKCMINTGEYSFFADINTIKINTKKENNIIEVRLKYYINDAFNEILLKVEL